MISNATPFAAVAAVAAMGAALAGAVAAPPVAVAAVATLAALGAALAGVVAALEANDQALAIENALEDLNQAWAAKHEAEARASALAARCQAAEARNQIGDAYAQRMAEAMKAAGVAMPTRAIDLPKPAPRTIKVNGVTVPVTPKPIVGAAFDAPIPTPWPTLGHNPNA